MLILASEKWTWTEGTPEPLLNALHLGFCRCPCGCDDGSPLGSSIVQRSNPRSVTLRCPRCGLLWTMTLHQMAKAARRHVERRGLPGWGQERAEYLADVLAHYADAVKETRGRKSASS